MYLEKIYSINKGSSKLVKIVFCGQNSGKSVMFGLFMTAGENKRG